MKKKIIFIVSGACLLVILGTVVYLWFTKMKPEESANKDSITEVLSRARPIVLDKVTLSSYVNNRSFPGIVDAVEKTQLSFRIQGPLIEVNVKPGDVVKKGELLMQVDPRDFQDNIRVLEAQLAKISAQYKKAASDFERAEELFSEKVISQADYDSAQSAYDASVAAVKDYEAQLQTAKHQLDDTFLIAPYTGVITKKYVENHEMINVGQVVLGMQDISRLKIEVEVPENEIAKHKLQNTESAQIQFPSKEGPEYTAALMEWNTSADPVTRTYTVVFVMDAPENASILPGMTAQAKWVSQMFSVPVLTLPARSVVADNQKRSFVWVFDSKTSMAQRRFVETGELIDSHRIQILKGVEPGEFIVSEGANFITDTMELHPQDSDSQRIALNERTCL